MSRSFYKFFKKGKTKSEKGGKSDGIFSTGPCYTQEFNNNKTPAVQRIFQGYSGDAKGGGSYKSKWFSADH